MTTEPAIGPADWTPDHYRGQGMQPFDVINAFGLDFYEGNVLKYLLRWRRKNGVEDLCKARTYLQVLIDQQQADVALGCGPECAEMHTETGRCEIATQRNTTTDLATTKGN
jgi:hypothetical protein